MAMKKKTASSKKVRASKEKVKLAGNVTLKDVHALVKKVADNKSTGLPKIITDINTLKKRTTSLSKVENIDKAIGNAQSGLKAISTKLNDANNKLKTTIDKLKDIGKLAGIEKSVTTIKNTISGHNEKLTNIHSKIGKLDTIDDIKQIISDPNHGVGAISNGVRIAVSDLGKLSTSMSKLENLLDLDAYLRDSAKGIPGIRTELTDIFQSVKDIVSNGEHGLTTITKGITTAAQDIETLTNKIGIPANAVDIENALKDEAFGLPYLERGLVELSQRLDDLSERQPDDYELSLGSRGNLVEVLHEALTKLGEKYANPKFGIPENEVNSKVFGNGTRKAVVNFQRWTKLKPTGIVDKKTRTALSKALVQSEEQIYRVEGHIYYADGLPLLETDLELHRVEFQKSSKFSNQNIVIVGPDDHGSYVISYKPPASKFNIEVRAKSNNKVIANSGTVYNATEHEVVNLVVEKDQRQQASEFNSLNQELTQALNGKRLRDAQENETQRDITLLHESTGWDARLIAMAATSDKLRGKIDDALPLEGLYGLMRLGLPGTPEGLIRLSEKTVVKALSVAKEKEIISSSAESQTFKKFKTWYRDQRKKTTVPGSLSTPESILKSLKLPVGQEKIFWNKYFDHQFEPKKLWKSLRKQNLPVEKIQVQGKLSLLTLNNEPLIKKLMTINAIKKSTPGTTGPELIKQGFHKSEKWEDYILKNLANSNLEKTNQYIPPAYTGENNQQKLNTYSIDLARKLRISYPSHVLAKQVADNEIKLSKPGQPFVTTVDTVIQRALDKGFKFGRQALDQFIRKNEVVLFQGIGQDIDIIKKDLKRLQRAYNLAPRSDVIKILLELGFESAEQIMAYSMEEFLEKFGHYFAGTGEAILIYRRASEIQSVTYSFIADAQSIESGPPIPGLSLPAADREVVRDSLIRQFPTVETLFGSQDFCECEHCRSVLSPAAYFVDLLQFLDPEDKDESSPWKSFLKNWEWTHNGDAYINKYGISVTKSKPYDVLINRRPDLAYLPLTCENTHTQLPYVDIVNEIFEYYVVNKQLASAAAHDTGSNQTTELLAEPQNLLEPAYDILRDPEYPYPVSLPFDLWHETIRLFSDHFQIPFWKMLETMRSTDDLIENNNEPNREQVFREVLGILPKDWEIFTRNRSPAGEQDPVEWFKLYGYANADEALDGVVDNDGNYKVVPLTSAKKLSRCLDVTYKEMASLVSVWFVNPGLRQWDTLRRVGISTGQAWRYQKNYINLLDRDLDSLTDSDKLLLEELKAVDERLTEYEERYKKIDNDFNVRQWLDDEWNKDQNPIGDTLVLHDPDAGCNFDATTLRHADGEAATTLEYFRLNLFVRLWKRMRCPINELDRAIEVLLPGGISGLTTANIGNHLRTILVYLSHLKELHDRLPNKKGTRLDLVYLWAGLATKGKDAQYARVFLKNRADDPDPVFDHPTAEYLENLADEDTINKHLLKLQGALELSTEDIVDILYAENPDLTRDKVLAKTKLSIDAVSTLYRYNLFAKRLRLSVRELIILKQLTGGDPFVNPKATPILRSGQNCEIDEDYLFDRTLKFIDLADKVKNSGFKITDLDYLVKHRFDPVGTYRRSQEEFLIFCKQLITIIQHATSVLPAGDQDNITDEELQKLMSLVMPSEIVTKFFAMKTGASEWIGIVKDVDENDKLDPGEFVNGSSIVRIQYDRKGKRQILSYRGVLTDGWKHRLPNSQYNNTLFIRLLEDVESQIQAFYEQNFQKSQAENSDVGFLTVADFEIVFKSLPENSTPVQHEDAEVEKLNILWNAFRPYLSNKLRSQAISQQFTNRLGFTAELTEALLTKTELLHLPGQENIALMENLERAKQGVSLECYLNDDLTGQAIKERAFPNTALAADSDQAGTEEKYRGYFIPPEGTKSVRFTGYLEVPISGTYDFIMKFKKQDAAAHFILHANPDWSMQHQAGQVDDEYIDHIELEAGIPYQFSLEATHLNGVEQKAGHFALLVRSDNLPEGHLQRLTLYPGQVVAETSQIDTLLSKIQILVERFEIGLNETEYILNHAEDFEGLDLSRLPTSENDPTQEAPDKLFKQIMAVADYTALRREIADGTEDLIDLLNMATVGIPKESGNTDTEKQRLLTLISEKLAELVRRQPDQVEKAITALAYSPELTNGQVIMPSLGKIANISRVWKLLQIAQTYGVDADRIKQWAKPEPDAETAKNLRATLKANYSTEIWFGIIRPISDVLRRKQRDALVAYLLVKLDFQRPEQLFEHFLVDPGMEPVVKTSRIRLSISSVQLFIQRCLLNYETKVHPSTINSSHWEWMKRYRVWEANRKIFLYPENWLEPEFRDDKTFMFNELESSLLQGDIDNQSAESAFLHYLRQLDELARLEIVTLYCEEKSLNPGANTVHVIGRTYNLPHKYYYRRYAYGRWTAWEPVTAEIEGDHLVVAMWRGRLNLFWVTFLEEAASPDHEGEKFDDLRNEIISLMKRVKVQLSRCEYYKGEWGEQSSSGFDLMEAGGTEPLTITVYKNFSKDDVTLHISKEFDQGMERAIRIELHLDKAQICEWHEKKKTTATMSSKVNTEVMFKSSGFASNYTNESPATLLENLSYGLETMERWSCGLGTKNIALRVVGNNASPSGADGRARLKFPYGDNIGQKASLYYGKGKLMVSFVEYSSKEDNEVEDAPLVTRPILEDSDSYSLAVPSNVLTQVPEWVSPFVSPFFYQDDEHTFYVEPRLEENNFEQWESWIIFVKPSGPWKVGENYWKDMPLARQGPSNKQQWKELVAEPGWIEKDVVKKLSPEIDWLTDESTVVAFDERIISSNGSRQPTSFTGTPRNISSLNIVGRGGLSLTQLRSVLTIPGRSVR